MLPTPLHILTVTDLTTSIKTCLEQEFLDLWLEGEVSNLRMPRSGHLYFTLKDHTSQIRAVLFRSTAHHLRFTLRDGMQVIVHGRLSVYEPRGEYQIIVDHVEPEGVGALQIAFEQLKEKLTNQGLFDQDRKRPLPFFPRTVGLVTSLSGATIRDILTILQKRCPLITVLVYPVPVQGAGAAEQIAEAIQALSASGDADVMIVGRGGGSLEDLWCFNEEIVVRAVADSAIPVVSAVGHEVDYTLTDFAADYRAPTPSAAAEVVVPLLNDVVNMLWDTWDRLERVMKAKVNLLTQHVHICRNTLPDPMLWFSRSAQRLDDLESRLRMALNCSHALLRPRLLSLISGLHTHGPQRQVVSALVVVPQLLKRMKQGMSTTTALKRHVLRSCAVSLNTLSPLAVLSRGYSIVETVPEGDIVRNAQEVTAGERVRATLAQGQLLCVVEETRLDR